MHVESRSWYKNTFLFICLIEELFYQKHKNNFEYSPFSCCRAVFLLARCKMFRNCKYYCPVITKQMQTYHFLYKLWKILFVWAFSAFCLLLAKILYKIFKICFTVCLYLNLKGVKNKLFITRKY